MRTVQEGGIVLMVVGGFLGAVWYFHDRIPEFTFGSLTVRVAQPPLTIAAAVAAVGFVVLLVGTIGAAVGRATRKEEQDEPSP